jgi:hypothetical protein
MITSVHTWPGAELVSARSIERTLLRQRAALAALAGAAAVVTWLLMTFARRPWR